VGHPEDRELGEDLLELRKEHMLFETQDWHDDPDQPRKDPDEEEMQKDLDLHKRKAKEIKDVLQEVYNKMEFFRKKIQEDKTTFNVDRKVFGLLTPEEIKKQEAEGI
jgi:phenylacetate-coenzyme A ligase PaaK-like adenylate-forming protein